MSTVTPDETWAQVPLPAEGIASDDDTATDIALTATDIPVPRESRFDVNAVHHALRGTVEALQHAGVKFAEPMASRIPPAVPAAPEGTESVEGISPKQTVVQVGLVANRTRIMFSFARPQVSSLGDMPVGPHNAYQARQAFNEFERHE